MGCRVEIWEYGEQECLTPADPDDIARMSPLWAKDMRRLCSRGPWTPQPEGNIWIFEDRGPGPVVMVVKDCPSTMDIAWRLVETGRLQPWDSLMAVTQTKGRGQHQRRWLSPAGNLHASWLWPLPEKGQTAATDWRRLTSLAAGFVLAEVLRGFQAPVRIKWPNDLLIRDRKFGGILIESRENQAVVGIGLNLMEAPEDRLLRDQFAVPATHLQREGFAFTPLALWNAIVTDGRRLFESLVKDTAPADLIRLLNSRLAWTGQTVAIRLMDAAVVEAVILGLAPDGGLRVKCGDAVRVIYSGSLIPA